MANLKEIPAGTPSMAEGVYPYGTRICLDTKTLEKMEIEELPEIGIEVVIKGKAIVMGESEQIYEGKVNKTLDLQITDLELEMGKTDSQLAKEMYQEEIKKEEK